jgi:3-oxoacyl-[acyl-carrier protein] reductase
MRRLGQSEEVAAAIMFLASPQAAFITGHSLAIEGGKLAG